ncbi:MAG: MmgE/PrpD family protein [Pseudorhodobacter sp.]
MALDQKTDPDRLVAGPSQTLSQFASTLRYEDIPSHVLDRARLHILDGLGLAFASTQFPFAGPAVAAMTELSGENGTHTIIGSAQRASVRDAATVNGVLVHGLDYDDTHLQAIVHPTAAVLPAVLAMGESYRISGKDALVAYCLGMESAVRIGAAVDGGFHHTGFHATSIISHFSAALVAGRLMGNSQAAHVAALGIAASTAGGVQVFLEEGAWTKRLHPGWGSAAGITAATLAKHGFKGPSRAFEGRFALFETHLHDYAKDVKMHHLTDGFGQQWMMGNTALKPYPVCHFIHGAADAAVDLYQEIGGTEIEAVNIRLPEDTLMIVAEPIEQKRHAGTEYEAKFSAPFVVASTLLKGRFGLPDLTENAIADSRVRGLAARCSCNADPDALFPEYFSGGVEVKLADGRILQRHVPINSGAGDRMMDEPTVSAKFFENATMAISRQRAEQIRTLALDLDNRNLPDLLELLGGE